MVRVILLLACLLACQQALAWSPVQKWALVYASQLGSKDGLALTEAAVVLQESHACVLLVNPDDPSYGCGGLLKSTAEDLLGRPTTSEELMNNFKLNIQLSEKYLASCVKTFGWARGLVCYNSGPDVAKSMAEKDVQSNNYVLVIRGRMEELKSSPVSTD